jgi:precorrin-4/cobalt-precorrin-4 C11-methyltransferase
MTGKVWFVGAGPGDPELITVKGARLLEAGGRHPVRRLAGRSGATLFAPRRLRDPRLEGHDAGGDDAPGCSTSRARHATVVRLQTGDPGLYGALVEMTRPLDAAGIAGRWCRACRRPWPRPPPPAKP